MIEIWNVICILHDYSREKVTVFCISDPCLEQLSILLLLLLCTICCNSPSAVLRDPRCYQG